MVKLFVGNLSDAFTVTSSDLRQEFEKYGSVSECERVKNYAFVHMDDPSAAQDALHNLNGTTIKGDKIRVEMSDREAKKGSLKLFIGNLSDDTTKEELRALFERFVTVLEADVIKNFGFVHIDANEGKSKLDYILHELNDYNLNGHQIRVQQSTSTVRKKPGMQGDQCFKCGLGGHWSKDCPNLMNPRFSNREVGYNAGRPFLRGLRGSIRGGPITDLRDIPPYINLRGRSVEGSSYSPLGGIPFTNRIGQDPYPRRLLPAYMQERNDFCATEFPNNLAYLESVSRAQIDARSALQSRQGTSVLDQYGRFNFSNENGLAQNNMNGMRYTNFSNTDPIPFSQLSNFSSESLRSYPRSTVSEMFDPDFSGRAMY